MREEKRAEDLRVRKKERESDRERERERERERGGGGQGEIRSTNEKVSFKEINWRKKTTIFYVVHILSRYNMK